MESIYGDDIDLLAKHFEPKIGFWRPGKGCILPRENRSITCLTHSCEDTVTKDNKLIQLLIDILYTPWSRYDELWYPKFIGIKLSRHRRRRWLTPKELKVMILEEKKGKKKK